ncbi:hypothetical protein [Legionella spiritensis]|uniref:Uncharacterized protein n=1 Tax=Legionella spiritensis TaxID=452 RepID=A0A0W0Z194_LEGSP|nr:hypothetical protein [Legionella spiritensis]KTD62518.1 hypothetical protein Lspi_1730 [Legionella spiritensis]SNV30857.1 Uncharacterised protein [Legionella spiritensis]VEG92001.1 Uncharacterised protein [Legionella spiritensis]
MANVQEPPKFADFLARMILVGKLNPMILPELVGKELANRVLDNANNLIGAPALGGGHIPVLQGQTHEYLGAIPDIKARLAMLEEILEAQNKENTDADNAVRHTPKL